MSITLLEQYLRDWLESSTPYLSVSGARFSEAFERAPIDEETRLQLLPRGTWVVVEQDGKFVVLAGIELRKEVGEKGFSIVVCNENNVVTKAFWVRKAATEWTCHYSLQEKLPS